MLSTEDWRLVTDGGLETDLIFHRGVDLPEFTAYPLVSSEDGRSAAARCPVGRGLTPHRRGTNR